MPGRDAGSGRVYVGAPMLDGKTHCALLAQLAAGSWEGSERTPSARRTDRTATQVGQNGRMLAGAEPQTSDVRRPTDLALGSRTGGELAVALDRTRGGEQDTLPMRNALRAMHAARLISADARWTTCTSAHLGTAHFTHADHASVDRASDSRPVPYTVVLNV